MADDNKQDLFYEELCRADFDAIPYINAESYHSKTIAYSIWHILHFEDIVVHTVINEDEQVFFTGNYGARINAPVITTGNEFVKQQIADFSKIAEERKGYLKSLNVVSIDEHAVWLIDYWCNKDVLGLIQMPFSRHN